MSSDPTDLSDRRRRHRYFAGLPARVHIAGLSDAASAELADLSAVGCFLKGEEVSFLAAPGDELAFGCRLGTMGVALARGRVVRRTPGNGLGIAIEHANDLMDMLLGALAREREEAA